MATNYYKYKIERPINVSKIITIHYFELTKDFKDRGESHNFWELHYVDRGHIFCYADDKENELFQGDLLFYKPMVRHYITTDNDISPNVCIVSFECSSEMAYRIQNTVYKLDEREKNLMATIFDEANKTFELPKLNPSLKKMQLKPNAPMGSMQLIELALEELIIRLLRKELKKNPTESKLVTSYGDKIVNDVIVYLNDNLTEKLSLSDIASKIGYGKTFLCTRFKRVTGKTIFRFFAELQIKKAKQMIRDDSNNTISVISDALNFSEPAYFCNVFKKITGMSPKEYSRMIHAFDKE